MNLYARLPVLTIGTCATLLLAMAGCGGGGEPSSIGAGADAEAAVAQVRLEGCVDAGFNTPSAGTPVRARTADGRWIAGASSNADGVFTMEVPARRTVAISIDAPDADALEVLTGQGSLSIGGCLRDTR